MDVVLDSIHPLHCIGWNGSGPTPFALEHMIARSHAVLQTLELDYYPLEDILNQLANSAKFSRLTTLITFKISLSSLIGNQFPALRKIEAQRIMDLGLLRDPAFLPTLRSVSLVCDHQLKDDLEDSDVPDRTHVPSGANARLLSLSLNMRSSIAGADDLVGDEAITGFNHYIEPIHLPNLSSLSIAVTSPAYINLMMSCLSGVLAQEHALRVLVVRVEMYCDDLALVRFLRLVMHTIR